MFSGKQINGDTCIFKFKFRKLINIFFHLNQPTLHGNLALLRATHFFSLNCVWESCWKAAIWWKARRFAGKE
jgi:hypothetical protein